MQSLLRGVGAVLSHVKGRQDNLVGYVYRKLQECYSTVKKKGFSHMADNVGVKGIGIKMHSNVFGSNYQFQPKASVLHALHVNRCMGLILL